MPLATRPRERFCEICYRTIRSLRNSEVTKQGGLRCKPCYAKHGEDVECPFDHPAGWICVLCKNTCFADPERVAAARLGGFEALRELDGVVVYPKNHNLGPPSKHKRF